MGRWSSYKARRKQKANGTAGGFYGYGLAEGWCGGGRYLNFGDLLEDRRAPRPSPYSRAALRPPAAPDPRPRLRKATPRPPDRRFPIASSADLG